jgi:hypothetical protein
MGEKEKGLTKPFLAINAKGEIILAQSKRTAPPPFSKLSRIISKIGI